MIHRCYEPISGNKQRFGEGALVLCPDSDLIARYVGEGAAQDHDQINQPPDAKAAEGEQLSNARANFAGVKTVDTQVAQEKT